MTLEEIYLRQRISEIEKLEAYLEDFFSSGAFVNELLIEFNSPIFRFGTEQQGFRII